MNPRRYLKAVHGYMEGTLYRTLGKYRDPNSPSITLRLDVALILTLSALIARFFLSPIATHEIAFFIFLLSAIVSAWLAGFWSGLMAIVFSIAAETFLFNLSFNWYHGALVFAFAVAGAFTSFLIAALARARYRTDEATLALRNEKERKEALMSIASHELKTPLAAARLFADILMRETDSFSGKKVKEHANKISEQIDRLSNTASSFLELAAIEKGKICFEKKRFCLSDTLEELVSESKLSVTTHLIDSEIEPRIHLEGDEERIRQVAVNLIGNATKYSLPGTRILISLKRTGSRVVMEVRDFGFGISKENMEKIFDPFFQGQSGQSSEYKGLGIGLYLVREIIREHSGVIEVESEENKGATFIVSLPPSK